MKRPEGIPSAVAAGSLAGLALATKRALYWRHEALHDPLTGLLNRRGLDKELEKVERPVGVLKLDITQQKLANDELGHHVGDSVIQKVSHMAIAAVREHDIVARTGGDEFIVVLTDRPKRVSRVLHHLFQSSDRRSGEYTPREVADIAMGRIQDQTTILLDEDPRLRDLGVNVAVGSSVLGEGPVTFAQMDVHADAAMYVMKGHQHDASGTAPRSIAS